MKEFNQWQKFRLRQTIKRKCKAFNQAGYPEIDKEALEKYFWEFRWKRKNFTTLTEALADIAETNVNDFFDYQQFLIQTKNSSLAEFDDFSDLF
ncbi:hypothetical protein M2139_000425 [Enterococcus sp. PF1-24]|uniref:post-transcriptional regulator n=1 Tax=unclassified Enterococcus TaxID=2608891 RepID=UPI002476B231|nr:MULTISPECIES: post-transcriptional regulator [unclassified Enterococcus]MDH6363450.1 hypothetical protein [Enterococcus sp. PFB1-1]MDH6400544.1 hypothetical protein [Enterococcus sp. PF1-24]